MRHLSAIDRNLPPHQNPRATSPDALIALVRALARQAAREAFQAAINDPVKPDASTGGAP
jgi:hypothetical protein